MAIVPDDVRDILPAIGPFFPVRINWFGKRSFCRPSIFKPPCGDVIFCAVKITPLLNSFFDTVNFYISVLSCVVGLLFECGPSAIFRRVISVNIYSVYRMFTGWFFAHICEKLLKRIAPTLTHFYSAPAIIFPSVVIWVGCPFDHFTPCLIGACMSTLLGMAVLYAFFMVQIKLLTTTRSCISMSQIAGHNYLFGSTNTLAKPCSVTTNSYSDPMNYFKISEFFTSEINKGGHDSYPPLDIPYNKNVWRADTDFSLSPVGLATVEV